ncbi:hypothetical protein TNIN_347611 [Trichonephila inaurata madagascariensis]|uniref:C2H2-type domain-containing protein n=1 Tax=Trichonephila inaurata madagascariensis TaxID=2747483 RepID=A0A8X7C645_9ARAC|nr:hypothetical protein TNIN_347611 [Trichonephila inaurata madagascariensis]
MFLNLLIKPCSVALTRLNLCDYNKETLLNNTDDFLEQQPSVTTSYLINKNEEETLKCDPETIDLTDEVPNKTNFLETENCVHRTLCNSFDRFHDSKEQQSNVTTSHLINETLKCYPEIIDLTDEVPNRTDFHEAEDCVDKALCKTFDGFHNSKEHPPNVTTSHLINERKDKTLKCAPETIDLTDEIPNITNFRETKKCGHRALCETFNGFHDSEEKELLNSKLHCGIYASSNFKKSDGVLCTQQHQSVKTHKKNPCSSLNTFTKTDFKLSHASRYKKFYKKCVNKKNTEIKEGNNQPLEETYSKILNKVQVNRDKNKSTFKQNSIKEINHDVGNKASTDPNWSLGDEKNSVSFHFETSISSNCIEDAIGNNEQSFNSFPCSSHLNRISMCTRKINEKVENTPNKFAVSGVRRNLKLRQKFLCNSKNDVLICERCNAKIVKNVKPCSVVLSHLKPQAAGYITDNSSHLLQSEEKDKTSFHAYNGRKNKISEPSSNFIKYSVPSKKENGHYMVVPNIVRDLVKAFEDYISEREKNNQIKKYKPRDNSPRIFRKSMCRCNKCDLQKMRYKRLTSTELFHEHLAQLNSSSKILFRCEACKRNYSNNYKNFVLSNANKSLNVLKYENSLDYFKKCSELKDTVQYFGERSTLNIRKECRDSKFLLYGSRKVKISGNTFKFHSMSVAKTVSPRSIHKKKESHLSEDLQNTKCDYCGYINEYPTRKKCQPVFSCIQCYEVFRTNKQYYNHLCSGKRKVGYLCDICEEILKTATEYAVHVKDHFD